MPASSPPERRIVTRRSTNSHRLVICGAVPRHGTALRLAFQIMELYLAMAVGAMTGFGIATPLAAFHGKWWLSIPAGALGGLAGSALWADSLASSLQDSTVAGTAVAAAIGGAALSLVAAIGRRLLAARMHTAPRD